MPIGASSKDCAKRRSAVAAAASARRCSVTSTLWERKRTARPSSSRTTEMCCQTVTVLPSGRT